MPLPFIANRLEGDSHAHLDNNSFHRVARIFVDFFSKTSDRSNAVGLADWVRLVLRERQPH
jgi:hypothetical protein